MVNGSSLFVFLVAYYSLPEWSSQTASLAPIALPPDSSTCANMHGDLHAGNNDSPDSDGYCDEHDECPDVVKGKEGDAVISEETSKVSRYPNPIDVHVDFLNWPTDINETHSKGNPDRT